MYKIIYSYRPTIPKQDRHTLWQRCENTSLDIIENILLATQASKKEKVVILNQASIKLNFLRFFLRLAKEIKILDIKKYIEAEQIIDEIGRMLGGWIKSVSL